MPIDIINNKARYNQIDAKYHQMAFRSVLTSPYLENPWSNKTDANLEDSACLHNLQNIQKDILLLRNFHRF